MHRSPDTAGRPATEVEDAPDLVSQLESLLDCIWRCEAEWRLDDRIDLTLRLRRGVYPAWDSGVRTP